ncbi:MAG: ribosome-associated translation inhibitor RaiA [Bacteroidota bacterium]
MQFRIHAPWEVNTYLSEIIKEKLNKLEHFFSSIQHADVFLAKTDNHQHSDNKNLEIRLKIPGATLFAEAREESFEKGAAECYDKLKVQLIRLKEKRAERY